MPAFKLSLQAFAWCHRGYSTRLFCDSLLSLPENAVKIRPHCADSPRLVVRSASGGRGDRCCLECQVKPMHSAGIPGGWPAANCEARGGDRGAGKLAFSIEGGCDASLPVPHPINPTSLPDTFGRHMKGKERSFPLIDTLLKSSLSSLLLLW